jgi:hypothetical protein
MGGPDHACSRRDSGAPESSRHASGPLARRRALVLASVAAFGLASCGRFGLSQKGAAPENDPDVAVFEFGGDVPILREQLRARGLVEDARPDRNSDGEGAGGGKTVDEFPRDPDDGPVDPLDGGERDPDPEGPRATPSVLVLGEGDTLSELCQRELGRGSLWRRVAEFNGWSEAEVSRLRPGTEVRVPDDLLPAGRDGAGRDGAGRDGR